jgi:hypothetical protein
MAVAFCIRVLQSFLAERIGRAEFRNYEQQQQNTEQFRFNPRKRRFSSCKAVLSQSNSFVDPNFFFFFFWQREMRYAYLVLSRAPKLCWTPAPGCADYQLNLYLHARHRCVVTRRTAGQVLSHCQRGAMSRRWPQRKAQLRRGRRGRRRPRVRRRWWAGR